MKSKLVLGTVQFGLPYGINNSVGMLSSESVFEILDCAKKNNITELDTADAYGTASKVLQAYFSQSPDSFKVMSKTINTSGLSFANLFQESLNNLGLSSLEGYYFHRFSDFLSFNDFHDIHMLKASGKLKKLAVSLYTEEELEVAAKHPEVDVIQLPYNLLDRGGNKDKLLIEAKSNNKEVYVRSVFLQGLFFMESAKLPVRLKPLEAVLQRIHQISLENEITIEELCLNYVLSKSFIDKVVIGVDSKFQLSKNISSVRENFSSRIVEEIELIQVSDRHLLNPSEWNQK